MQKKIKVIFILVISLIVMIYAGNTLYEYFAYTPSERYFYKELKRRIKKGEKEIYLKDLTDFEWDEVCPIKGYSFIWSLRKKRNDIDVSNYIGKYPLLNENKYGFVFLFNKKLIKILKIKNFSISIGNSMNKNKYYDIEKYDNLSKIIFINTKNIKITRGI